MRSNLLRAAISICVLALVSLATRADTFSNVTSVGGLGANASINWGQLGACAQGLANPSTVTASNGLSVSVTLPGSAAQETIQRNANGTGGCSNDGWFGNFTPGDNLLFSGLSSNPVTLAFATPVTGVGMQIANNLRTAFTATITAFNGATQIGTFSESGTEAFTADGTAIFIGLLDLTGQNITSLAITTSDSLGFGIDTVSLNQSSVPEPCTLLLLGTGVIFGAFKKRGKAGGHPQEDVTPVQ